MSVNWMSFNYEVNAKKINRIPSDEFKDGYFYDNTIENSISKFEKLGLIFKDEIDFEMIRSENKQYICYIDFTQYGGHKGYDVFDLLLKEKIWGEDFIDDLKNNKANIIVSSGSEGDETLGKDTNLSKLNQLLESFEIPYNSVLLVGGVVLLENYKDKFKYNLICNHGQPYDCFYRKFLDLYKNDAFIWLFNNSQKYLRLKHFWSPNNQPRIHRLKLIQFLKSNNLLEKGLVSFPDVTQEYSDEDGNIHKFSSFHTFDKEESKIIEYIKDVLPLSVDTYPAAVHYKNEEVGTFNWNPDGKLGVPTKRYTDGNLYTQWDVTWDAGKVNPINFFNSYFEVTTESHFGQTSILFTEKIWKPLLMFSPIVCIHSPLALKSLRKLGFKTFDGWVDESYDKETNTQKRLDMAFTEIKKLCDMELVDLHKKYFDIKDILIYNHKHFFDTFIPNMFHEYLDVVGEMINE